MSGLTWLHLSDWHQKDFRIDPKVVRDRLVKDIEGRTAISPDLAKIDFIVFSGDVASKGRAEEYKAAKKEFFDYLLEAAGVSPRRLFIVPGNHDLDDSEIEKLPNEFKRDAVSKENVDLWLEDATKRESSSCGLSGISRALLPTTPARILLTIPTFEPGKSMAKRSHS